MSSPTLHRRDSAGRAALLHCLADGRARTALELAHAAGTVRDDAEALIAELLAARVLRVAAQGRHTYYALAAGRDGRGVTQASTFRPSTPVNLRVARTCYSHLAGALGVALHDCLLARGWLLPAAGDAGRYDVTPAGITAFAELQIDVVAWRGRAHRCARPCLDRSERRPHLGGALGGALCDAAVRRRWITRSTGSRQVVLTRAGQGGFEAWLGAPLHLHASR